MNPIPTPEPDRDTWETETLLPALTAARIQAEQSWTKSRTNWARQFPAHPRAAEYLAANPVPGVEADEFPGLPGIVPGIPGVVLVGWSGDPPDIDGWLKGREESQQAAQAQAEAQKLADQEAAATKTAQLAQLQADHDHLVTALAQTTDLTEQATLRIAIGGAQRLMA